MKIKSSADNRSPVTGVILAGVGGQGIILAGELLAEAALEEGLDVKKSEIHGMAQRGGSVISHVRFGKKVASPLIREGEAEYLLAFEEMEGLRYMRFLKQQGTMIINRQRIYTLSMLLSDEAYPDEMLEKIRGLPISIIDVDGPALAREAGHPKTVNTAVLGVLASRLKFSKELWHEVLKKRLPEKLFEVNWTAFQKGFVQN